MSKFNLQIDGKGKSTTEGNWDWWYGGGEAAWSSLANAKLGVPLAIRKGKTVGVFEGGEVVEYIWGENDLTDNGLVLKQGSLSENLAFTNVDNDFSANQTFQEATFDRAFSENQAVANNELVRLDQLNSAISGLNWQHPVLDNIDLTTSEPTTPTVGDRYINSANGTSSVTGQSVNANDIYEWDGLTWAEYTPSEGWTVWDESVDQNYTFNGTDWVEFGSTVSHNNTTGLQGGQSGQYYHLTEAQFLAVSGDIDAVTLNGENGAYYLNYNNFTNIPNLSNFLVAADIVGKANLNGGNNFTGNQAINGIISANNLSGTNTGDETKVSIDALGVDSATLEGENGAYYLDYNNLNNKPTTDNYGYFQLQTNSVNRKQIASQNVVNFLNGNGISVSYSSNGAVTITNTNIVTNNNQITNGAGYVTSSGNTVIGTSDDIVTPSTTVINRINLTDGVIDSFTTRTLTLADLGYTGDTDANKITNNTQITNGRGFVTSSGNTIIGTDLDISNTGAQVIESLNMTDGVITSHTVRNLSLGNLGYTGDTDANKITDNSQIGNGRGYITSYVNTQLTKEQVEDFVGGMVTGNTETNISVTYNDTTGKLNFVSVNTQLSNAQVTAITNPLYLGKTAKAVDSDKLNGQTASYYLDYNNFSNKPTIENYGYFQLQTNSINRKQIASENVLNFLNGSGINISYSSSGNVTISNTITNNNQLTNGAGYITSAGNTQLSKEQVEDYVGLMVQNNVETNISVTYDDSTNKLNFSSVNTQLSDAQVKSITDPLYLGKTAKAVDSDKLDGQDSTYYLNYNNFSNTPDLGVYAKLSGGNSFSGNQIFSGNVEVGGTISVSGRNNRMILAGANSSSSTTYQVIEGDDFGGSGVGGKWYVVVNKNNTTPTVALEINGQSGNATFSGNVGIGTSNPLYKQHISTSGFIGQFIQSSYVNSLKYYSSTLIGRNAVNNESAEFGYLYDSENPNNSYSYINTFGQIQGSQFVLTAIGNVGIGTNSPQAKLDVNGNAIFSGNVDIEGLLYVNRTINEVARFRNSLNNSSPFFSIYQGNSRKGFFQYNNSADSIRIESDTNNIDFFASGTRQLLLANGNATFSGNISANNLSGTNTGDQDLSSFLTASDISGKANKDGGNTFNGNQIFQNDVEVGGSIKIKQYSLIDYGNYGGGLGTSLAYQSQNGQHNFIDDNGEVANVRAKYKSADGSEGLSGTFGAFVYKNGLLVSASV